MATVQVPLVKCSFGSRRTSIIGAALHQQHRQLRQRRQPTAAQAAAATQSPPRAEANSRSPEPQATAAVVPGASRSLQRAQQAVLDALTGVEGRGKGGLSAEARTQFDAAVAVLEADGGLQAPTTSPLLEGRWRLVFTTRPGTASPIQRTFTGVEAFSVYQDIELADGSEARVCQVVDFGDSVGYLKVEAEASTDSRPLPGFTPREGKGLPFGILGVSSAEPPARRDLRIDFQAAFYLKALPFKVPYPVPFQLLGDERKGWIDITYLAPDGSLRLSRGNKARHARLLEALAQRRGRNDAEILQLVEEVVASGSGVAAPAASPLAGGTWRLLWTQQGDTANPLQKALADKVDNFQILRPEGRLENLVCLAPGVRVRACASCAAEPGATRTSVDIDQVLLELGPLKLPLPIKTDGRGFVEWSYLDEDFRITQGNKGSVFIHTRESSA
ncbi:putative plastid-lipid-associated protein 12 [Chlorella vulgaris]